MAKHVIHAHSSVSTNGVPKLPEIDRIEYGEIAINYATSAETISFKNTNNELVQVKTDEYYQVKFDEINQTIEDNELVTASALNDLNTKTDENNEEISEIADNLSALSGVVEDIKNDFDTFMSSADVSEKAIDTLKEIQDYINADSGATAEMLNNISKAQTTANSAYTYANRAFEKAESAYTYADKAKLAADAAQTTADSAITAIDNLNQVIEDNELVTASALNDLNTKTDENNENISEIADNLSALSGVVGDVKNDFDTFMSSADVSEKAIDTLKEIQDYINADSGATAEMLNNISKAQTTANSAYTYADKAKLAADGAKSAADAAQTTADSAITAIDNLNQVVEDNELVTASALNDLNSKADGAYAYTNLIIGDGFTSASTVTNQISQINTNIKNNALVTASALNDLNTRLNAIPDELFSFLEGANTTTSVASIPVTKRLCVATLTGNDIFSLASAPSVGREIHIIVKNSNSSDITIILPSVAPYNNYGVDSLTVKGSGFGEINAINDGRIIHIRTI